MIRIVNIYNQRAREIGDWPARRQDWQKIIKLGRRLSTLLGGDFNAHSELWEQRCTERTEAIYWEEITDGTGLVIGKDDGPTHNLTRNESDSTSIFDLTWAKGKFGKWTIWDGNHATGSDDELIE
jgi:hypothetical protein